MIGRAVLPLMIVMVPTLAPAEEGWTVAISGEVRVGQSFTAELPGNPRFCARGGA